MASARQIVPRQRRAGRRCVSLVEDQVDHAQHRIEALGQLGRVRHLIGNARVANLGLCADDPLRQRRRRREERLRDLFRRQAADFAERERHLRVERERRMAAGEDQAQAVVFDALGVGPGSRVDDRDVGLRALLVVERLEALLPAQAVDRLEPSRRHQPGARVRRARHPSAIARAPPETRRASLPRRRRSRRGDGSASRARGGSRTGRRRSPSRGLDRSPSRPTIRPSSPLTRNRRRARRTLANMGPRPHVYLYQTLDVFSYTA